jgi:hypothetical protein
MLACDCYKKLYVNVIFLFQVDDATDHIHVDDRIAIKRLIVDMMLHSPRNVQKQLSDAIYIIGRHDFPKKWPDLLSQMVEKCASGECYHINNVLSKSIPFIMIEKRANFNY